MTTTAINDNAISPIKQDLFGLQDNFRILRGWVEMHRVDQPVTSGVDFLQGEWCVLNNVGTVDRPTSSSVQASFLVIAGTDRYDSRATGNVTTCFNSPIVAKTTYFDTTASYAPGDKLCAVLLTAGSAAGKAGLKKAGTNDPVHAKVVGQSGGVLTFSVLPN